MMKTVCLPAETWAKITRRLTFEVGADYASRQWAGLIQEQTDGGLKVRATRGGTNVTLKAPKGGDLRCVVEALAGKRIDGSEVA